MHRGADSNNVRLVGAAAVLLASVNALLPPWPSTYDVAASTLVMPCNSSGLLSTELTRAWGLVSYDWSNTKRGPTGWVQQRPMDCEERLPVLAQAQAAKSANPSQRAGVYRNSLRMLDILVHVRVRARHAGLGPRAAGGGRAILRQVEPGSPHSLSRRNAGLEDVRGIEQPRMLA